VHDRRQVPARPEIREVHLRLAEMVPRSRRGVFLSPHKNRFRRELSFSRARPMRAPWRAGEWRLRGACGLHEPIVLRIPTSQACESLRRVLGRFTAPPPTQLAGDRRAQLLGPSPTVLQLLRTDELTVPTVPANGGRRFAFGSGEWQLRRTESLGIWWSPSPVNPLAPVAQRYGATISPPAPPCGPPPCKGALAPSAPRSLRRAPSGALLRSPPVAVAWENEESWGVPIWGNHRPVLPTMLLANPFPVQPLRVGGQMSLRGSYGLRSVEAWRCGNYCARGKRRTNGDVGTQRRMQMRPKVRPPSVARSSGRRAAISGNTRHSVARPGSPRGGLIPTGDVATSASTRCMAQGLRARLGLARGRFCARTRAQATYKILCNSLQGGPVCQRRSEIFASSFRKRAARSFATFDVLLCEQRAIRCKTLAKVCMQVAKICSKGFATCAGAREGTWTEHASYFQKMLRAIRRGFPKAK
jgi:hypothetical protein